MIRRLVARLQMLFKSDEFRRDLDEEMAFHIDSLTHDLIRGGMEPSRARREAILRFGSRERVKARSREARGLDVFDEGLRNLRFGFRGLVRSRLHTGVFITTLALCIGLGTAAFTVVDASLLRPLPYPSSEKLAGAVLYEPAFGKSPGNTSADGRTWERIRDEAGFLDRAVYSGWTTGVNLSTDEAAAYVQQQRVGAGFFRTLGLAPALGRDFEVAEDVPGGPPLAVLSHELWTGTFGGDRDVLGSTIRLKGEAHTVVGVMPADFHYHLEADVWTPLRPNSDGEGSGTNYGILVRIPESMSFEEAEARVAAIAPPEYSEEDGPERRLGLVPLKEALTAGARLPVLILLGAVTLMLVVGCANLAGLQIARSYARQSEMATRQALGSGSGALVRQMVVENLILGILGGSAGILLTSLLIEPLEVLVQANLGTWQEVNLNLKALAAGTGITILATLLFGLTPVLQVAHPDIQRVLVSGARSVVGGGGHVTRKALLVGQVAIVTALLFSAGLLVRSYAHLDGLDPGFDPEGVLGVQLSLDDARYARSENVLRLFQESLDRIRQLPSVSSAGVSLTLPYERPLNLPFRVVVGDPENQSPVTNAVYVTPGFFETLEVPVLRGRVLEESDREGAPWVVVANQAFLDANLGGMEPLGARVELNFTGGDGAEIVGVVGNIQQSAGWGATTQPVWETPTLYLAAAQMPDAFFRGIHIWFAPSWVVKTSSVQPDLTAQVMRAIGEVDPDLPMARAAWLTEIMDRAFTRQRFQAGFLLVVGAVSLLLAGIGLYGIVAHEVMERRAEMGLRIALGATPGNAVWEAGIGGVRLTLLGLALGAGLSGAATRLISRLVWGVTPFDPVTVGILLGILASLAAVASFIPAARVGRMDPAEILRQG